MSTERQPIFGITTGTGTTAPPRTEPVTPEKQLPKKKKGLGKTLRLSLAGLAALGAVETTGAVVSEQTNNEQVSAHTIVEDIKWPLDIIPNLLGRKPEAAYPISNTNDKRPIGSTDEPNSRTEANRKIAEGPSTFDKKADKIVIGPNNTVDTDRATLESLPSFDANGKPIFIFDLKLPEGKEIIVTKELHTRFFSEDVAHQAKTEGKRNYLETTKVPIGSKEIAPIDGRVFILSYEKNGSITPPIGVKIEFIGPDGTLWFYNIGVEGIIPSEAAGILNIAVDAPRISPENSNGREWEKGLFAKVGTLLFTNNKVVKISRYLEGGKNGSLAEPDGRLPGDIQYHTDSSQKLIGPE